MLRLLHLACSGNMNRVCKVHFIPNDRIGPSRHQTQPHVLQKYDMGLRAKFCRYRAVLKRDCQIFSRLVVGWYTVHRSAISEKARPFISVHKKLSYRRETARQLHMTTWAGQLTF